MDLIFDEFLYETPPPLSISRIREKVKNITFILIIEMSKSKRLKKKHKQIIFSLSLNYGAFYVIKTLNVRLLLFSLICGSKNMIYTCLE